jgi:hypothetical protein
MRKLLVFLAGLMSAGHAADVASAATVTQCQSRLSTCINICFSRYGKIASESCRDRCYGTFTNCMNAPQRGVKFQTTPPKSGASTINNPLAVPLSRSKSRASGITNVQAIPLNQTGSQYVRPGPNGNPCTVHCGSLGGRKSK